jgi:hypothetical protein
MKKELSTQLSKRLASFKVKDKVVKDLAKSLATDGLKIGRLGPCAYGICFDLWSDKAPKLDALLAHKAISHIEIFPYGIIDWDRFHVKIGVEVPGR